MQRSPCPTHRCRAKFFAFPDLREFFLTFPLSARIGTEQQFDRKQKITPRSFRQMRAGGGRIPPGAPKSDYKKENYY